MQPSDIARVQAYLRKTLGSDRIYLDPPKTRNGSVEVRAGDEFIGTLHRDEEDGEISVLAAHHDPGRGPATSAPTERDAAKAPMNPSIRHAYRLVIVTTFVPLSSGAERDTTLLRSCGDTFHCPPSSVITVTVLRL